jgi:hypothetical protein
MRSIVPIVAEYKHLELLIISNWCVLSACFQILFAHPLHSALSGQGRCQQPTRKSRPGDRCRRKYYTKNSTTVDSSARLSMGHVSLLLLGVLCAVLLVDVESAITAAQATSNLMRVAASLPSTDAPSIAWQNSTWNLAGENSRCLLPVVLPQLLSVYISSGHSLTNSCFLVPCCHSLPAVCGLHGSCMTAA